MGPISSEHRPTDSDQRAALQRLLDDDALSVVFQPIVDLSTAQVAGYEALARPASELFPHAGELFDTADRLDEYASIERRARQKAFEAVRHYDGPAMIFINNSAPSFMSDGFIETICDEIDTIGGLPAQRIVLEITERTAHDLITGLSARSHQLQQIGFDVALDDVGAGISGLNQIMTLRPNWMKLDIELVSNIDLDPLKQNLIRFFVHFARLAGMKLVAEGIERPEELRLLIELGVAYGQGFLLARPGEIGATLAPEVEASIREYCGRVEAQRHYEASAMRISSLCFPVSTCDLSDTIGSVRDRIGAVAQQRGLVVLDRRRYVGWLERDEIVDSLDASPDAPVRSLEIGDAMLVGEDVTVVEAVEIVAGLSNRQLLMPLVVQNKGEVVGILPVRQVLLAVARSNRRAPETVSPLAGVPGRIEADRWITNRIRIADPSNIAFVDIRDFDAYNLAYGFDKGDQMLTKLTDLLQGLDDVRYFAHLGADRFMLAFVGDAIARLESVVLQFEAGHGDMFSPGDLQSGGYECFDVFGRRRRYPLTTLRMVYLPAVLHQVVDARSLHYIADRLRLRSPGETEDARRRIILQDREVELPQRRASA